MVPFPGFFPDDFATQDDLLPRVPPGKVARLIRRFVLEPEWYYALEERLLNEGFTYGNWTTTWIEADLTTLRTYYSTEDWALFWAGRGGVLPNVVQLFYELDSSIRDWIAYTRTSALDFRGYEQWCHSVSTIYDHPAPDWAFYLGGMLCQINTARMIWELPAGTPHPQLV